MRGEEKRGRDEGRGESEGERISKKETQITDTDRERE